jgi:hypothetical protein
MLSRLVTGSTALVVAFLIGTSFLYSPYLVERTFAGSVISECGEIRPGMSQTEVLRLSHQGSRPTLEDISMPDRLVFSRAGSVCTVQFDKATGTVAAAAASRAAWSWELTGNNYE